MRSNNPINSIPISESDRNGNIYTKEVIEKVIWEFDGGAPLMMAKDEVLHGK